MKQEYTKNEVIAKGQFAALHGGEVHITGLWVWVAFKTKPTNEVRQALKAEGFRWGHKKQMWYFAGKPRMGKKSMDWFWITGKYGDEQVSV